MMTKKLNPPPHQILYLASVTVEKGQSYMHILFLSKECILKWQEALLFVYGS